MECDQTSTAVDGDQRWDGGTDVDRTLTVVRRASNPHRSAITCKGKQKWRMTEDWFCNNLAHDNVFIRVILFYFMLTTTGSIQKKCLPSSSKTPTASCDMRHWMGVSLEMIWVEFSLRGVEAMEFLIV